MKSKNSFKSKQNLVVFDKNYKYFNLKIISKIFNFDIDKVPISKKILLENLIRNEDQVNVSSDMISNFCNNIDNIKADFEIAFFPCRVLMQDFTGVPAIADLAAMRNALKDRGYDPKLINPLSRVDLVIDHSLSVESFGNPEALKENVKIEFQRNKERYEFLKWGQKSFKNFYLVPPGAGICHQVNLESIAKTIWSKKIGNQTFLFPDTLVGTDSHTTMINALSVLGWGVGGIEAEAAILGEPISMKIPKIVGFKLEGKLNEGITATDLVLSITNILRAHGVVGKFIEFYGEGLSNLSLADRATISNMAPEYGATCGFFPTDKETINYLKQTGKSNEHLKLVELYSKVQGLWLKNDYSPRFDEYLKLNLNSIESTVAGPKRPQDKILLKDVSLNFKKLDSTKINNKRKNNQIQTGDIVIAAITSCTNTSNPYVMLAAGLVAKKAIEKGLSTKPWVKTSLAPGSQVVTDYLKKANLTTYLDKLGFNLVGYGCTTCIGNSGPLDDWIVEEIRNKNLTVCSVLSGNRNFEGRVHQEVKANFLASPPLVVAFALVGNINIDLLKDPLGKSNAGDNIYLKDIWPTIQEIKHEVEKSLSSEMFIKRYKEIYKGDINWQAINGTIDTTYQWKLNSSYIKHPPFFFDSNSEFKKSIKNAHILALLGDSITTDHISPAGSIKEESPAGIYLANLQINKKNFNSYGSRRGNHEVMIRGTFANIRIRNEILPDTEGGITKSFLSNKKMTIYDAAMEYKKDKVPLVIIAGKEYGSGSSRDWAAKGTKLLGVKAVIAESFERIHRSNLIGMGVLPLQFINNQNKENLHIKGSEKISILGLDKLEPNSLLDCQILSKKKLEIKLKCRIDTNKELEYYNSDGILQYVLNSIIQKSHKN